MNDSLTTMNERLKNVLLGLLIGGAAAFMMYPSLEDWPLAVTLLFTAAIYGLAGYALCRIVGRGLWYSGLAANAALWILIFSLGLPLERDMMVVLATAVLTAYAGTFVALMRIALVHQQDAVRNQL